MTFRVRSFQRSMFPVFNVGMKVRITNKTLASSLGSEPFGMVVKVVARERSGAEVYLVRCGSGGLTCYWCEADWLEYT